MYLRQQNREVPVCAEKTFIIEERKTWEGMTLPLKKYCA